MVGANDGHLSFRLRFGFPALTCFPLSISEASPTLSRSTSRSSREAYSPFFRSSVNTRAAESINPISLARPTIATVPATAIEADPSSLTTFLPLRSSMISRQELPSSTRLNAARIVNASPPPNRGKRTEDEVPLISCKTPRRSASTISSSPGALRPGKTSERTAGVIATLRNIRSSQANPS